MVLANRYPEFPSSAAHSAIWIALVGASSIAGSLVFACAAPLAAIAALAASTMDRKTGLALVLTAWLSNQIVGYGFLGYPQTLDSVAWGMVIGIATVVAFACARAFAFRLHGRFLLFPLSFVFAFATYELVLFAAGLPLGASSDAFSAATVWRVFEINVVAFVGLFVLHFAWSEVVRLTALGTQKSQTAA